jgi:hypothetical protein
MDDSGRYYGGGVGVGGDNYYPGDYGYADYGTDYYGGTQGRDPLEYEYAASGAAADEDGDPKPKREQVAILLLGLSGSGKSFLCRYLIDLFSPSGKAEKVYAVNDKTRDCTYEKLDWTQLHRVRRASVVVEDVISATPKQFKLLQELLNFGQHHKQIGCVVVIAHTATSNNIFGLIPSFHYIYVSAVKNSISSLHKILNHYGYEKEEKAVYVDMIMNCSEPYCHLRLDVAEREIKLTKAGQQEELGRRAREGREREAGRPDIRLNAVKFLSDLENSKKALLLFDHIVPRLPPEKLDRDFLTVTLTDKAAGEPVVVSLIDYLSVLTDPDAPPDHLLDKFHSYVKKRGAHLPRAYVLNRAFW